jgi:predicted protein tyrosine phosphatase
LRLNRYTLPVVMSHEEAGEMADEYPSVVSLVVSDMERLVAHRNRLERPFADILNPGSRQACTVADVKAILRFGIKAPDPVLVHCEYGQSRSTAVAFGILAGRGYGLEESYQMLALDHPPGRAFMPNLLVLARFDQVLGRNGELLRVGSAWCSD